MAGGHYTGVQAREGITQSVYISKTVTIRGSYTPPDWTTPNPIANPTIVNAQGQGRVFYVDGSAGGVTVILYRLHITGGDATGLSGGEFNQYEGAGGGVYVTAASFILESSNVYGNKASQVGWGAGGGVYVVNASGVLWGNTIHHNIASSGTDPGLAGEGGGVVVSNSSFSLVGNTIHNNTASTIDDGIGGGIYMESIGPSLSRNVVRNNTASATGRGDGGGIYIGPDAHASLVNTVVMDNVCGATANSKGAGIFVEIASPTLEHTTIHDNTGGDGSGVMIVGFLAGTIQMTNTILISQTVGISATANQNANLDGVLWFANGANTGGDGAIVVSNPITDNPEFAADGYHLLFGSPAVDAGLASAVGTDVDNQPRPFGAGYDLGADELLVVAGTVDPLIGLTLIYTDTQGTTTTLEIPPGAVFQTVAIVYTPIPTPTRPLYPEWQSSDVVFFLDAYLGELLLPGYIFQRPVSLTVHYTDSDISGLDESTLRFYYWEGYEWVDGSTTCFPWSSYTRDPANNVLSLPICHLSEWHMGGAPIGGPGIRIYLPLVMRAAP